MRIFGSDELELVNESTGLYRWGECLVSVQASLDASLLDMANRYASVSTYPSLCTLYGMTHDHRPIFTVPGQLRFSLGHPFAHKLDFSDRLEFSRQVAYAMKLLHEAGVTHGSLDEVVFVGRTIILMPPAFDAQVTIAQETDALFNMLIALLTNDPSEKPNKAKLAQSDLPDNIKVQLQQLKPEESASTLYSILRTIKVVSPEESRQAAIVQEVNKRWRQSSLVEKGYQLRSVRCFDLKTAVAQMAVGVVRKVRQRVGNPHFKQGGPRQLGFENEMKARHIPATYLPGITLNTNLSVLASFHGLAKSAVESVSKSGPAALESHGALYGKGIYMSDLGRAAHTYGALPANLDGSFKFSVCFFAVPYYAAALCQVQMQGGQRTTRCIHGEESKSDVKVVRVQQGEYYHIAKEPAHVIPLAELEIELMLDIPTEIMVGDQVPQISFDEAIFQQYISQNNVQQMFSEITQLLLSGHPDMPGFFERNIKQGILDQIMPESTRTLIALKVFDLYRERSLSDSQLYMLALAYSNGNYGFVKDLPKSLECMEKVLSIHVDLETAVGYLAIAIHEEGASNHQQSALEAVYALAGPDCDLIRLCTDHQQMHTVINVLTNLMEKHFSESSSIHLDEKYLKLIEKSVTLNHVIAKNDRVNTFTLRLHCLKLMIDNDLKQDNHESARNRILKFLSVVDEVKSNLAPAYQSFITWLIDVAARKFCLDLSLLSRLAERLSMILPENRLLRKRVTDLISQTRTECAKTSILVASALLTRLLDKDELTNEEFDRVSFIISESSYMAHRSIRVMCASLQIIHFERFALTADQAVILSDMEEIKNAHESRIDYALGLFYLNHPHLRDRGISYLQRATHTFSKDGGSYFAAKKLMEISTDEASKKQWEMKAFELGDPVLFEIYFSDQMLEDLFFDSEGNPKDCGDIEIYTRATSRVYFPLSSKKNNELVRFYKEKFKGYLENYLKALLDISRPSFSFEMLDKFKNESIYNLPTKDRQLVKKTCEIMSSLAMLKKDVSALIDLVDSEPSVGIKLLPNTVSALCQLLELITPIKQYAVPCDDTDVDYNKRRRHITAKLNSVFRSITALLKNNFVQSSDSMMLRFGIDMSYGDFASRVNELNVSMTKAFSLPLQGKNPHTSDYSSYMTKARAQAELARIQSNIEMKRASNSHNSEAMAAPVTPVLLDSKQQRDEMALEKTNVGAMLNHGRGSTLFSTGQATTAPSAVKVRAGKRSHLADTERETRSSFHKGGA